jgi:hypothetical protein
LVWLNIPMAYSFVMISPNLHAIWVFLLTILSQDLKLVLLKYFGTLGAANPCRAVKISLRGTPLETPKKPCLNSWQGSAQLSPPSPPPFKVLY